MTARIYFSRAGRAGGDDFLVRVPQLRPLSARALAVFGVGCLGAPSILEFARAGIAELRIIDHDFVDPGTIARWPLGLNSAGLLKVCALACFIQRNYPATRVRPIVHKIGQVREPKSDARSDSDVIAEACEGVSAIYDATAEIGVQQCLSETARELGIPYICVVGTYGGWGGKIACIDPARTKACWMCYRHAFDDETLPEPPSDPNGDVQPFGCGDTTFTGAGFDLTTVALAGVRAAVSILCGGAEDAYPPLDWDVMTVALRDEAGAAITPTYRCFDLTRHPACSCGGE